jgi:hypothetical protein
LKRE